MINHLENKHVENYKEYNQEIESHKKVDHQAKRPKLLQFLNSKGEDLNVRKKNFQLKLMEFIYLDFMPFNVVNGQGFQSLMSFLAPNLVIHCNTFFSRTMLPKEYETKCMKIKKILNECEFLGSTTDMSFSVHYIDKNWIRKKIILSVEKFNEAHTSENLFERLNTIIDNWNIRNKIQFISTDNAFNIVKAVKSMNVESQGCFAHHINLIIRNSLKNNEKLTELIRKIRTVINTIKNSVQLKRKFRENQMTLNMKENNLIPDIVTRWNSTFFMLERFLQNENPVRLTLNLDIDEEEIEILKQLTEILKIFAELTNIISKEDNSISVILPSISSIKTYVQKYMENLGKSEERNKFTEIINFGENLINEIEKYFSDIEQNWLLCAATILDPRYKETYFKSPKFQNKRRCYIINEAMKVSENTNPPVNVEFNLDLIHPELKKIKYENSESKSETEKSFNFWDIVDKAEENNDNNEEDNKNDVNKKLQFYLKMPIQLKKTNPLLFWNENGSVLYTLNILAKKFFSFPACTVTSERLFSAASQIITKRRNMIKAKNAEMLLVLRENHNI